MSKNNFTTQSIPLEQLTLHPDNVRHRKSDADKINPIAASIASIGLINPLTVTLINKDSDEYGVLAGGRRLQALDVILPFLAWLKGRIILFQFHYGGYPTYSHIRPVIIISPEPFSCLILHLLNVFKNVLVQPFMVSMGI